jgi:predicted transcriptional regulator of viral defense system
MEQEVLNTFEGRLLISMEEIQDLFNKKNTTTLRNLTSSLMKKGVLHQMKRGLYLS